MRVTIKPRWNSEYAASDINFDLLSHSELVTYIYVSELCRHCCRYWLNTYQPDPWKLKEIFDQNTKMLFRENAFEKVVCKRSALLFRTQCVKPVNMASQSNTGCDICLLFPFSLTHRACMMTSSNGNIFRVTGPLCGEFTGPGEFPTQRPVTRSFDVFFDLRLNKRLSKQPWGWWFEAPSWSLWRQYNVSHGGPN